MADDRWIVANVVGVGDCAFRTDALPDGATPPAVIQARKFTLIRETVGKDGKPGITYMQAGSKNLAGAHLALWSECNSGMRSNLARLWGDLVVPERPPLSIVGKE